MSALPERPPASVLVAVRLELRQMAHDLERLRNAGTFAEQTPYGHDIHTPKLTVYFEEHYAGRYLEHSEIGLKAWLDDVMPDSTANICRAGKPFTAGEPSQYLKDFGAALLRAWLITMAEETPMFLREIVHRGEFQRRHSGHVRKIIETWIASAVAAKPTPVPISEPGVGAEHVLRVAGDRESEAKPEPEAQTAASSLDSQPPVHVDLGASKEIPSDADNEPTPVHSLAEQLKQLEEKNQNLRKKQFAHKCGISPRLLQRILHEGYIPAERTLLKIADNVKNNFQFD